MWKISPTWGFNLTVQYCWIKSFFAAFFWRGLIFERAYACTPICVLKSFKELIFFEVCPDTLLKLISYWFCLFINVLVIAVVDTCTTDIAIFTILQTNFFCASTCQCKCEMNGNKIVLGLENYQWLQTICWKQYNLML